MNLENITPIEWKFSERAQQLKGSIIREILKITQRPEVISFAGGLPSPKTFPVERMRAAYDAVLTKSGTMALQYGPTDGYLPLREFIAARLSKGGATISPQQVMMVSGSQQALDLVGKVLLDEGSTALVETPSYLGALQAFSVYSPKLVSVAMDEAGVIPADVKAKGADARFMYCLPNYQNPSGITLSIARREELVETCARMQLPLLEDDPYGELCYRGEPLPKMLGMNPQGVVYMGTFSKVLTPGIRLGFVVAPLTLLHKLEQAKQASDLHTAQITQMVAYEVIKDGFLDEHIPTIRSFYEGQCNIMLDALRKSFPAGVTWTIPDGGMFIWVKLPKHINSMELSNEALAQNVAFVPGVPFYAGVPETNTMRLSFVTVSPERIYEGIEKLGKLIASKM